MLLEPTICKPLSLKCPCVGGPRTILSACLWGDGFCLDKHLEAIQRHYIQRALREAGGVKSRAARVLGMKNYQTLDAQLRRLGVEWEAR